MAIERGGGSDGALNRRGRGPLGQQVVCERLPIGAAEVGQRLVCEGGEGAQPQPPLIGADGGGLVERAAAGPHDARLGEPLPFFPGLPQRRRMAARWLAAAANRDLRVAQPALCLGQRIGRKADEPLLLGVPEPGAI